MSNDVPLRPILARNMTAKADYLVPGNPMIARPESGVGNAHPGLEFDVRALDRHFLPGLVFDFQYGIGAKLISIDNGLFPDSTVSDRDIASGTWLWAIRATFGSAPGKATTVKLAGLDGYMVLRRIMDLEPGEVTVAVGPAPDTAGASAAIDAAVAQLEAGGVPATASFSGQRAGYLDDVGVIDPTLMPAGEITRNLCSPWQWDFADCYCYYWASSKPDIVVGVTGDAQILNFQRDRSFPEPERPSPDPKVWMGNNITEPDLIVNWEQLPIVTSDREGVVPRVPHWPLMSNPMSVEEIATELAQLAGLEHALCVEYLYARYSIKATRDVPMAIPFFGGALARHRSAHEIFNVAKDEMRHFRWVNEALRLLDKPPCMIRAETIGRDLERYFELRPLLPSTLDEFIGIEAPSSVFNDDPQQLDGVYTRILVSLHHLEARPGNSPEMLDKFGRLKQLMKVIIDEGESHWERFRRVKEALAGQRPAKYLHFLKVPGESKNEQDRALQSLGDAYYDLLLHALYITFALGRGSRGTWLTISHQAMFALDDSAFLLTERGSAPLFTEPDWLEKSVPSYFALDIGERLKRGEHNLTLPDVLGSSGAIDNMFKGSETAMDNLEKIATGKVKDLVAAHRTQIADMKKKVSDQYVT
jgi:hypothetical protein